MDDESNWSSHTISEENRLARGRIFELLISVGIITTLLGLGINIISSVLTNALGRNLSLLLAGGTFVIGIVGIALLVPRIGTTVKEFHQDIEICIPIMVRKQDIEVIRIAQYGNVTDVAHAAIARIPLNERKQLAELFQEGGYSDLHASRIGRLEFCLNLSQLLLTIELMKSSKQLLGSKSPFWKLREVADLQTVTRNIDWESLADQVPNNRMFKVATFGVPQNTIVPAPIRVKLPDIHGQLSDRAHRPRSNSRTSFVTLLRADVNKHSGIHISALGELSEHGLPTLTAPRRGLTARSILRNARDNRIRALSRDEERAANLLDDVGFAQSDDGDSGVESIQLYTSLHTKLYGDGSRPHLIRVFLRIDGSFRISFLSNQLQSHGLYAWSITLSKLIASMDLGRFFEGIKEIGQQVPRRLL